MYHETASSRSLLSAVTAKLKLSKVAVVGVGGTGSFILDMLAKTPVAEIHLFDDDEFLAHNAFRAPGALHIKSILHKKSGVCSRSRGPGFASMVLWGVT